MATKKIKISDNIRMLRESLNYSQEEVAEKMGLSQQAYSLIEKKPENTAFKNLQKIAGIFSVTVSTLIMDDSNFVQQNFNQQNCNIASQQDISSNIGYEKLITKLEAEINSLRSMLKDTNLYKVPQNVV